MRVELLEPLQSRLVFGLPTFWVGAHPLKFGLDGFLVGCLLTLFLLDALFLGFQPSGVVTFIGNAPATVQFENPPSGVIKEVSVVSDRYDGPAEVLQKVF